MTDQTLPILAVICAAVVIGWVRNLESRIRTIERVQELDPALREIAEEARRRANRFAARENRK